MDESDDEESGDEMGVEDIESAYEESQQEGEEDELQASEDDGDQDADAKSSTFGRFGVLAMDD